MTAVGTDRVAAGRRWAVTVGLAVFGIALGVLVLIGGEFRLSADEEAATVPLGVIVAPTVVGLLLVRLVPSTLPTMPEVHGGDRPALARQSWLLVCIAVLFALLAPVLGRDLGPLLKIVLFLAGTALVIRLAPAPRPPVSRQRERLPSWIPWLAPVPALLGWGYLSFYAPFANTDVSAYEAMDKVELVVLALIGFLTASLLEEFFFRFVLQTRLEALYGRWTGILAAALLFAFMHSARFVDGPAGTIIAVMVVANGGFGLFVGYLWSRYRTVWPVLLAHAATNGLLLIPILLS